MLASRARLPVLAVVLLCLRCGDDDAPPPPPSLSVVLGVQQACSELVHRVRLARSAEGPGEELLDRDIASPLDLPVSTRVTLGAGTHVLEATFSLVDGGGFEQIRQAMRLPGGTEGRIAMILPCVCRGVTCDEGSYCSEIPTGSGQARCVPLQLCGDGSCKDGETSLSCPADCKPSCGDDVCSLDESCSTCAADCGPCAGAGGQAGASGKGGAGTGGAGTGGAGTGGAGTGGTGSGGAGKGGAGSGGAGSGGAGSGGAGSGGAAGQGGGGSGGAGAGAGGAGGAGGAICEPTTCAKISPVACGEAGDGCGGVLSCGACPAGQTCEGNACQGVIQCDPISGDGCPAHRPKCSVFTTELACSTPGAGVEGQACEPPTTASDSCASQFVCDSASHSCQQLCRLDGECPPTHTCSGPVEDLPPQVGPVMACMPKPVPCDILAPSCKAGQGCYDDADNGIVCSEAGMLGLGQPCTFSGDCTPGNICTSTDGKNFLCIAVCDPAKPQCPSGGCTKPANKSYGVCL